MNGANNSGVVRLCQSTKLRKKCVCCRNEHVALFFGTHLVYPRGLSSNIAVVVIAPIIARLRCERRYTRERAVKTIAMFTLKSPLETS